MWMRTCYIHPPCTVRDDESMDEPCPGTVIVFCSGVVAMGDEGLQLQQEKETPKPKRLSCVPKLDALWFCYSPVYQMTGYYRDGTFDDCRSKWSELFDCISLKAKPADEVQAILEEREKKKPHIWKFRTPEEASKRWKEEFGHLQD